MPFTLGAGPSTANTGSGTSLGVTLAGTTAGRSVIVGVCWESTTITLNSVTCTGESVNLVGSPTTGGGARVQLAYVAELSSGGSKTFTANFSSSVAGAGIFAIEFAGGLASSFLDTSVNATATGTNPSTTLTTGQNNCLVIGVQVNTTGVATSGAGYTNIAGTSSWSKFFKAQYKLDAGAAGSNTVDWSNASSNTWIIQAASFNTVSSSPTITPSTGTLTAAGYAPTVGGNRSAATAVGSGSFVGYAPAISTSMSPSLIPAAAALALTGNAPTLVVGISHPGLTDSLLVHISAAEGYSGPVALIDLLTHSSTASGTSGATGSGANDLALHTLSAGGNETAVLDLLTHETAAAGIAGNVGRLDSSLLFHSNDAVGVGQNLGTAANDLLYHVTSAGSVVGNVGALTAVLAAHRLETAALSGNLGTASNSLLLRSLTAAAHTSVTGSAEVTLAGHFLEAAGYATLAETYRTWVLNLRNSGLTEFTNFEFNSFAYFDGKYLAAGPDGVFEVGSSESDAGTAIDWRVRTGSVDYDSSYLKRVPRLYVTGEFAGNVKVRTITSEDGERTYLLTSNGITGDQQRRVPIGKGPKALQWAFELEGVEGTDVRISKIMPYPQELRRRIA